MSKIQLELMAAAGIEPKKGEKRLDFLVRLVEKIQDVPDKVWDGLTGEAQDWYNEAADAMKAKKDPVEMPDYEEEKAAAPAGRSSRSSSKAKEDAPLTKVDDVATVVTARGTFTGKVLEIDDEVIVLDVDGKEKEISRDRCESITVNHGDGGGEDQGEDAGDDIVKVGNELEITNKRGKVYKGKVVEVEDELIVLDVDGQDVEIDKDRIGTIKLVGAKPARGSTRGVKEEKTEAPARSTRGAKEDADGDKPKRASNPAGVSVGGRIRELMCEDMEITADEVAAQLKKEKIEFRDTSLAMIFRETSFVFAQLKANGKLKK